MDNQEDKDPRNSQHGEELEPAPFPLGSENDRNPATGEALSEAEKTGGTGDPGVVPKQEASTVLPNKTDGADKKDNLWNPVNKMVPLQARLAAKLTMLVMDKRSRAGVGITGIVGIVVFFAGIATGPLEFIQFSQLMQKLHMSSKDETVNSRSSKILLYAIAGLGVEKGRMGVLTNVAADKWEQRLVNKSGLRPVYNDKTGRFAGYQIVDQKKAQPHINQAKKDGLEIRRIRANVGGQGYVGPGNNKDVNNGNQRAIFIDENQRGFKGNRNLIKSVGKSVGPFGISAIGNRLSKKRSGVKFHVLEKFGFRQYLDSRANKQADKRTEKEQRQDYNKTVRQKLADKISNGVKPTGKPTIAGEGEDKDEDGKDDADPKASEVDKDLQKRLDEYKAAKEKTGGKDKKKIRLDIVRSGIGATAIVGVLCAVKAVGDQQEEYKFVNNILPMQRMGLSYTSIGSQAQTDIDTTSDELGAHSESFYDEEDETSWYQANTIQQELGNEPTNDPKYELADEAQPSNIAGKSKTFQIIDKIPVLGTACDVQTFIFGLPVLKQVTEGINYVVTGGLKTLGVDTEELLQSGIASISGDNVDALAEGAGFGNLANTGMFLAGVDQNLSVGGGPLNSQQVGELKQLQEEDQEFENSQKSFAQRYFDAYDTSSLLGSTMLSLNQYNLRSISSAISSFSPLDSLASIFTPKAAAATSEDIYGLPKYGFSVEEQSDPRFENPFENGKYIETGDRLQKLNEKYGKCFNMTIEPEGDTTRIETKDAPVNILKIDKEKKGEYKDCYDKSEDLLRYRFYLIDTVTSKSLACYEGDEQSCLELGVIDSATGGGDADTPDSDSTVSGDAKEVAQEILDNKDIDINAGNFCRYCTEDIKNTADGKPAYGSTNLNIKLLQFLADLGKQTKVDVNSISGAGSGHSNGSNHYGGTAIDFGCNGISGKLLDRTGAKYGIKSNFERCDDGVNHWHYSLSGT